MKPEITLSGAAFTRQFSSTRHGAHLARIAATGQLAAWGWPGDSETSRTAALLVSELASNAVRHGRLPGRDFSLRVTVEHDLATLRIEVSDSCGEKIPALPDTPAPGSEGSESGRGLLLVDALAARWGTDLRHPSGKTVWAEFTCGTRQRAFP